MNYEIEQFQRVVFFADTTKGRLCDALDYHARQALKIKPEYITSEIKEDIKLLEDRINMSS